MMNKDEHGLSRLGRFLLGKEKVRLIEAFDNNQDRFKKQIPWASSLEKVRITGDLPPYAHALEIVPFWDAFCMDIGNIKYTLEYWITTHRCNVPMYVHTPFI